MKAVLQIDMPKDCYDCYLANAELKTCKAITITKKLYNKSIKLYNKGERPRWCPLKQIIKQTNNNSTINENTKTDKEFIQYLYENLINLMYDDELSSDVLKIFYNLTAMWEKQNNE